MWLIALNPTGLIERFAKMSDQKTEACQLKDVV